MSDTIKGIQSHILVALISALITVSLALGSYKERINNLAEENTRIVHSIDNLTGTLHSLELQVVALRQEMVDTRKAH